MSRAIIKHLEREFEALGGNRETLKHLPVGYSMQREAALRAEIRKLNQPKVGRSKTEKATISTDLQQSSDFKDHISDYPLPLHSVYLDRQQKFLKACSLKVFLNDLTADKTEEAYQLQFKIWNLFKDVDKAGEKLKLWREHRRILTEPEPEDYSRYTDKDLLRRRNTLMSIISNRSKTIIKLEQDLAVCLAEKRLKINDKLSQKKEELKHIKNELQTVEKALGR